MAVTVSLDSGTGETTVRFSLPVDVASGDVSVVGSFNDWTPGRDVLVDQGDGTRAVTVTIPHEGDIHFRYLAGHGHWFDDPGADEITDNGSLVRRPSHESKPATVAPAKASKGAKSARKRAAPAAPESPRDTEVRD